MIKQLNQLIYSEDIQLPLRLYIYALPPDHEYHNGGIWIDRFPSYSDFSPDEAATICQEAIRTGRQVRVCNGYDFLVFHVVDGKVVYPANATPSEFWNKL